MRVHVLLASLGRGVVDGSWPQLPRHGLLGHGPAAVHLLLLKILAWWTFRIFFISSDRGKGRGRPRRQGGQVSVFH